MARIFKTLNSPETVASFQRMCGLIPVEKSTNNSTGPENKSLNNPNSTQNGSLHHRNCTEASTVESSDQKSGSSSDEENEKDHIVKSNFCHYIFHFAANLGNEIFYITFFLFWFWNIDGFVGRRVCVFWCLFMYLGQATKDIVKWPRPAAPPVIRLEKRYALEYGMPSTHAMVGAGLPFAILYFTYERYIVSLQTSMFIICIFQYFIMTLVKLCVFYDVYFIFVSVPC